MVAEPERFAACALCLRTDFARAHDELSLVCGVEGWDCGVWICDINAWKDNGEAMHMTWLNDLGYGVGALPGVGVRGKSQWGAYLKSGGEGVGPGVAQVEKEKAVFRAMTEGTHMLEEGLIVRAVLVENSC